MKKNLFGNVFFMSRAIHADKIPTKYLFLLLYYIQFEIHKFKYPHVSMIIIENFMPMK